MGGEGTSAVKAAPAWRPLPDGSSLCVPTTFPLLEASGTSQPPAGCTVRPFDDYKGLAARSLMPGLCNRENLGSSHPNSAAGRAAPRTLQRLGSWLSNRLPAPPPSVAWLPVPMRAQSGLRVFMSRVGPLGCEESAGTHSPSHPSHLHSIISPLEARGGLFSCCCFSMIS